MTGIDQSGQNGVEWGSEAEEASDPRPAAVRGGDSSSHSGEDTFEGVLPEGDLDEEVTTEIIDGTAPEEDAMITAITERDEYLDSLRRLQAEFENYKKRVAKFQADQVARAAVSLVEKILPVLDTLDLAVEHLGDAGSADGRALLAVSNQLRDVLAKEGLERIDPLGEAFDPNAHEAVGHLPAGESSLVDGDGSDPGPTGGADSVEPVVGQVMRAGYRWRGAVVRPAMVMGRG